MPVFIGLGARGFLSHTISHANLSKEATVGMTRRGVRERRLRLAHIQPEGPAGRPYQPNFSGYYALERKMVQGGGRKQGKDKEERER